MRKHVLIILCTLLLTIGCKLHDPKINNNGISIDKIREAKELVLQKDSRVHIAVATGRRLYDGFMTDPDMTEVFKFIATVHSSSDFLEDVWELAWVNNEWSMYTTDTLVDMYDGIVVSIDLADIEMDVCDAWDLITEEHSVDSFYNWSLFQPLHPDVERPFFRFATETGNFDVDAITSEIEFEPR